MSKLNRFLRSNTFGLAKRWVVVLAFISLLFVWWAAMDESLWGLPTWAVLTGIAVFLLPWEVLITVVWPIQAPNLRAQANHALASATAFMNRVLDPDLGRRLWVGVIALAIFGILASFVIIVEIPIERRPAYLMYTVEGYSTELIQYLSDSWSRAFTSSLTPSFSARSFLYFILGIVVLRQVLRYVFRPAVQELDSVVSQVLSQQFGKQGVSRYVSYSLLFVPILVCVSLALGREGGNFVTVPENELVDATLRITNLSIAPSTITGLLVVREHYHRYIEGGCYEEPDYSLYCVETDGTPPVFSDGSYMSVNGRREPVLRNSEGSDALVSSNVEIKMVGSDYYFPFNYYSASLDLVPENTSKLDMAAYSRFSVSVDNRSLNVYPGDRPFEFRIEYAPYYRVLVLTVFFVLVACLWLVWRTVEKGTQIELSISIFATIVAMRGYLIPQELGAQPTLIDQVLLVYVVVLLWILLYKQNAIGAAASDKAV